MRQFTDGIFAQTGTCSPYYSRQGERAETFRRASDAAVEDTFSESRKEAKQKRGRHCTSHPEDSNQNGLASGICEGQRESSYTSRHGIMEILRGKGPSLEEDDM